MFFKHNQLIGGLVTNNKLTVKPFSQLISGKGNKKFQNITGVAVDKRECVYILQVVNWIVFRNWNLMENSFPSLAVKVC